jgi:phage terminase large subunit-like protein
MANPSLPYLPDLMEETEKEYEEWKANPNAHADFMTKRMNIPQTAMETAVTDWENIIATFIIKKGKKEIKRVVPDLLGRTCTTGIDYAMLTDWASVDLHFREGDWRHDINHSWLCLKSRDLHRLKCPWKDWAEAGKITLVDDVSINPDLLTSYIQEHGTIYNIAGIALDQYRYALLTNSLRSIGFDAKEYKNVHLVRPSDIMKVAPVIDNCFANQFFIWGDDPPLRWATNNTKRVPAGKKLKGLSDATNAEYGNYVYGKIEPKSRKTDPFMALVASMVIEDKLGDGGASVLADLPVITC